MAKNRRTKSDRRKDIWKKTNGLCAHCGKAVSSTNQTIDHIIPKSKGGTDDRRNILPLCRACNDGRGTNKIDVDEFYSYAPKWALDEFKDYLMDWKLQRSNGQGEIFVSANQWTF